VEVRGSSQSVGIQVDPEHRNVPAAARLCDGHVKTPRWKIKVAQGQTQELRLASTKCWLASRTEEVRYALFQRPEESLNYVVGNRRVHKAVFDQTRDAPKGFAVWRFALTGDPSNQIAGDNPLLTITGAQDFVD
jgi:hypothetical protein